MNTTDKRVGYLGDQAIVIGASIAGICHAAVLAQHFKRVIVLEADAVDLHSSGHRKGTPQDRQLHGLLSRGANNFERFFPGFQAQLDQAGASRPEFGRDILWFMQGTWWSMIPTGIRPFGITRSELEYQLRSRLVKESNIQLKTEFKVTGYLYQENKVVGIEGLEKATNQPLKLHGDLIVDCSGRHSQLGQSLAVWSATEIPSEEVEVHTCYATAEISLPHNPRWKSIYIGPEAPHNKRMALLIRAENNKYILACCGYMNEMVPTDAQGFKDFLQKLASPVLAHQVQNLEWISLPTRYKFKSNFRRYYSRLPKLPENLIVSGDAVCSFDPVYGQGMSAATMAAELLDQKLQKATSLKGLTRGFQKSLEKVLDEPWMNALANDFRFPEVQGNRTPLIRFMMAYSGLILQAMHLPSVNKRMVPLFNMTRNPLAILSPYLVIVALMVKLKLIRPQPKPPLELLTQ